MNDFSPTAFCSPERLAELRHDVAARRKARTVNFGILMRTHGEALGVLARRRCDRTAQAAIARLVAAGSTDARWTAGTTRDLRTVVNAVRTAPAVMAKQPAAAERAAWLLDRVREIAAQNDKITALEALLGALQPVALSAKGASGTRPVKR